MEDNTHPYRAVIVDDFLESERIACMEWPAYSLDINLVEYLWNAFAVLHVDVTISNHSQRFRNCSRAGIAIMDSAVVDYLVTSMIKRCALSM